MNHDDIKSKAKDRLQRFEALLETIDADSSSPDKTKLSQPSRVEKITPTQSINHIKKSTKPIQNRSTPDTSKSSTKTPKDSPSYDATMLSLIHI